jgi:hypothetical protein
MIQSRHHSVGAWWLAGAGFCTLMLLVHACAGLNSQGMTDFWRDIYWATRIAHGEALPLVGPPIYQMLELGPWWYYLLALPIRLTGSVAVTMALVQCVAAAKYFLAWRLGIRIAGERFGLACAVSLCVAGWSMSGLIFPSHTALIETSLLLLVLATWRCATAFSPGNALLFGVVAAACIHAHPTTVSWIAACAIFLLWRRPSLRTFLWLCAGATIVALSLLPPWLDHAKDAVDTLKPIDGYLGHDVGVAFWRRFPLIVGNLVSGGAWWGMLLMTRWNAASVQIAWSVFCACLAFAGVGLFLHGRSDRKKMLMPCALALGAFLLQVAFVVLLRPVTPVWMLPSCLPPLAFAIAIGWQGWLANARVLPRGAGIVALAVYALLALAPFSLLLRDIHATRSMSGANPFFDAADRGVGYVTVAVPFYPLRRNDALAPSLCRYQVLHGRLAAVLEPTFGSVLRIACGHWPAIRYGGVEGAGAHVAGLFARAATASGIAPDRLVAHMALYEHVRPIAPAAGAKAGPMRRMQISPDSAAGPPARLEFAFESKGADAVVLTNRLSMAAPMTVQDVSVNGKPAILRHDDGGSQVYRCGECAADAVAQWHVVVQGIAGNLDLVVLPAGSH